MKSIRKIWSLPLALVTALMLVGLLGAVVLAQVLPDPAPEEETDFVDQEIVLQVGASGANISPAQTALSAAFSDEMPDDQDGETLVSNTALAYTALTTNPAAAEVSFSNGDTTGVVGTWWDSLGAADADDEDTDCTKRAGALGSSVFVVDEDNEAADPDEDVPVATGYCADFADIAAEDSDADSGIVVQAFHWNLLTGPEMEAAAIAGGLRNPASYKGPFSSLTKKQREAVENLYIDEDNSDGNKNVLARGDENLQVANRGSDFSYPNDHDDDTGTAALVVQHPGEAGTTSITVKVSDGVGRFITNSVGQDFDVETVRAEIGQLSITDPAIGDDGTVEDGVGYRSLDTDGEETTTAENIRTYEFTISNTTSEIATFIVTAVDTTFMSNHQKVNFSLTDGNNLPFQIKKIDEVENPADAALTVPSYDRAEILVRPGVTLTESSYEFELSANELGNPAENSDAKNIKIVVAVDNTAPTFVDSLLTEATVAERAGDLVITTFSATDPNNQALTFRIDEDESDAPASILDELILDSASGELKTSEDGLDFVEDVADDPDTEDVDETVEGDNVHVIVILVDDGTLTDDHSITITVTDEPEPLRGAGLNFKVPENQPVDVAIDSFELETATGGAATGGYDINEQIDGTGARADTDDSLFEVKDDPTNGSIGQLFLKDLDTLDFEDAAVSNNYTLSVSADGPGGVKIIDLITIMVTDVNEGPEFSAVAKATQVVDGGSIDLFVLESAAAGESVKVGQDAGGNPSTRSAQFEATDEDSAATGNEIVYDLWYDDETDPEDTELNDAYIGPDALFTVDSDGIIRVATELDTDADDSIPGITLLLRAVDADQAAEEAADTREEDAPDLKDTLTLRVEIIDTNVAPEFDEPSRLLTHATVSEGAAVGFTVHTYRATDEDGDVVEYRLRDQDDAPFFTVNEIMVANPTTGVMEPIAELNTAAGLDFETQISHTVEIQAFDTDGDTDEIVVTIDVTNANDNSPAFGTIPADPIRVAENSPRGTSLGSFAATDADGDDVTYSLSGANAKSFHIDGYGELKTLESLDYDSNTPCSVGGCAITVVASDANAASGAPTSAHTGPAEAARIIMVLPIEDSVSTLNVTKANPVPGTTRGDPMTALGNTKESVSADVPERPADLPNAIGAPMNFVETDWASWGTVLRIQVTAQSPDANCGSGNECVIISLNSDSAGDTLKVQAYRMDTPAGAASNENKFVAAVMLVELDGDATDIKTSSNDDIPVYAHGDGSVPRLQVDEEDEIEIEFYNLRGDIEVENEAPEISNFAPEHESAFDDPDVEYTFTVTDSHSGLPEPEDLPDADGDDAYMPAVALISKGQCETAAQDDSAESKARRAKLIKDGFELVGDMANISDDESLYCPGAAQSGEYDADIGGYGFAPIRDDKDFDEIDDGFDVETTIVLRENKIFYVTFVACDNAGNCSFFDPDGNDEGVELAEITVDTEDPVFVEARTGLTWDSTDNEYDDNRAYIQVIFNDLTKLNTETVEIDDFVVEGHSIKDVHVFENPDSDDVNWADSGRYGATGHPNKRKIDRYRDIENVVFIELEDELLADETPDVTIVPNGVEDKAGNEQDDGDHEADDWISPSFTIVSIVSTRETSQDQILAGDDDEVTVVVTSDERLDSTRPTVAITYVNAPAGSVDTKGTATCDNSDGADKGSRERGEIVHAGNDDCADNGAATGGTLNNSVEKVSNTEWVVTITEPKDTGYYNFHISGDDRSSQKNPGSEGVSPGSIVTDFFDADGDVNVDDAIFFEGDINLPKPQVRVSGVSVEDNEADVEFRSPLFVELDFAANHSDNCRSADSDERLANCMNENSEYAEDNFDDIVVTSFVLDGVDLTDSVKTTDNQSFLVSLESISIGDHTAEVQAVDQAGNVFEDTLEIDFEVNDRDPFEKRLSPGWNLVSLPGEPADSSIAAVFGPGVEVRTVYSYDPVIPGGWQVAVRETLDSDWQGDLTEITGQRGYWVLSDAIQDWEVSIPRLAGGASGTGTPIQPPVIPMYAGWNLIPVTDVSGNALSAGIEISAQVYLNSLDDGLDLARVLGYDTIRNEWFTVLDMQMGSPGDLEIGSGYWVFVREAAALVPGGVAGAGGSGD